MENFQETTTFTGKTCSSDNSTWIKLVFNDKKQTKTMILNSENK